MKLVAWVDGGARGNPGPAGYGAVVATGDGREVSRLWSYIGEATNNVAEYSGLIAAVQEALDLGATELTVMTDSQLVQRQMTGVYKIRQPHLRKLAAKVRALTARLKRFDIVHVRREENRDADALANIAMDDASSGREPSTGTLDG